MIEQRLRDDEANWSAYFSTAAIEPLCIVYEDLERTYAETLRSTLRFLDLPVAADLIVRPPRLRQQRDTRTEQWVRGYLRARRELWPPPDAAYGIALAP